MTSSPTPGHGPWGEESWNESRPSRVPMVQIWMLSDEWLVRYTPLELLELELWSNSTNRTEVQMNIHMERRKLYTPQHKCRGYNQCQSTEYLYTGAANPCNEGNLFGFVCKEIMMQCFIYLQILLSRLIWLSSCLCYGQQEYVTTILTGPLWLSCNLQHSFVMFMIMLYVSKIFNEQVQSHFHQAVSVETQLRHYNK